jgi:aerobic carbon-monoxide dehydrogenase medium subunit
MKAPAFLYRRPDEIAGALALLGDHAGDAQVLAGGQSLIPSLNMRLSSPKMLIDINRIDELRGIEDRGGNIRIGALVRHAEVLESALVARRLPLLAMAVPHVAHMAVRNRGTLCGSVALADPSAEMPAVAVALNADIVLRKRGATRTVSARSFFQGFCRTVRDDDEMISEVVFPVAAPDETFGFSELSRRHGDFATVGIAVAARAAAGRLHDLNIVIFGSEAKPLLFAGATGGTIETDPSDHALAGLADRITQDMDPISNHQGRGDTKRKQAAVLLKRVLKDMQERATHVGTA